MATLGRMHSFESLNKDMGPGLRYLIILQGCPLRCPYCDRPAIRPIEEGKAYSPSQVIAKAIRYREYWGKDGGIAVMGGEPLMQMDFLIELFLEAKKRDISTSLLTNGISFTHEEPFFSKFDKLLDLTDFLLFSFKHIDEEKHLDITRRTNHSPKAMLEYLSSIDRPVYIRYLLAKGKTDDEGDLEATSLYFSSLGNIEKIEVLPAYLDDSPSIEEIEKAKRILFKGLRKNRD